MEFALQISLRQDCIYFILLDKDRVMAFTTDGAYYMMTAFDILKARQYNKLFQLECLAYRLHCVAEKVHEVYAFVDRLVSAMNKVFQKCPLRQEIFNINAPLLPLPPKPVITRWRIWLKAVFYYNENFDEVE